MNAGGVSQGQKNFPFSNIQQYEFFDDFENITNWTLTTAAGASTPNISTNETLVNLNPGTILNSTCGISRMYGNTNSTGNVSLPNSSTLYFKTRIKVNSIAATIFSVGFGHRSFAFANGIFNSGIYFNYSTSIGANFRLITSNNGVNTIVGTNIPVLADTFYVLECQINNIIVNYFINGVFQATISTNLPTLSVTPSITAISSGTSFNLQPDYWYHRQTFNTNRG